MDTSTTAVWQTTPEERAELKFMNTNLKNLIYYHQLLDKRFVELDRKVEDMGKKLKEIDRKVSVNDR